MLARSFGVAFQTLQGAVQRLPVGQGPPVARGGGLRQEIADPRDTLPRFVQAPAAQQRLGIQVDQERSALQQADRQARTPVEPGGEMLVGEQPVRVHAIHVVRGGVHLTGAERHFHGLVGETGVPQETATVHAQAPQFSGTQLRLQGGCHRRQQAPPGPVAIHGVQQCLWQQILAEHFAAIQLRPELRAQIGGGPGQMRQANQDRAFILTQARQQFAAKIVAQAQGSGAPAALIVQQQPAARAPAQGPQPYSLAAGFRGRCTEQVGQSVELLAGKCEVIRAQFQQLALQLQARQPPGGTPSAADPELHAGGRAGQQVIDPGVEFGIGLFRVVVEHQADGFPAGFQRIEHRHGEAMRGAAARQLHAELAGEAFAETGQRGWLAVQAQPAAAPAGGLPAHAVAEQHRLAVTAWSAEQVQALRHVQQPVQQARTGKECVGQSGLAGGWRQCVVPILTSLGGPIDLNVLKVTERNHEHLPHAIIHACDALPVQASAQSAIGGKWTGSRCFASACYLRIQLSRFTARQQRKFAADTSI
ncbi:hypothetical protein D9M71_132710 [compost metagenome]